MPQNPSNWPFCHPKRQPEHLTRIIKQSSKYIGNTPWALNEYKESLNKHKLAITTVLGDEHYR